MQNNETIAKVAEVVETTIAETTANAHETNERLRREDTLTKALYDLAGLPANEVRVPVNEFVWSVIERKNAEAAAQPTEDGGEVDAFAAQRLIRARTTEAANASMILRIVEMEIEAPS